MENIALVGLSRQVALRRELDVIANNMANVNTTGFKREDMIFHEFISPTAREDVFRPGSDRKVSFVWDRATWHNLGKGNMQGTNNQLDVAIGSEGFFTFQTPQGERLSRNGALQIDIQNRLVNNQGFPIMGEQGPIVLDPMDTNITIGRDGTVSSATGVRGKIRLVDVASPKDLDKKGDNFFALVQGAQTRPTLYPDLRQGFIERSNVQPVTEMSRLVEVTRSYASMAAMLDSHDQMRRNAIKDLSGVST